MSDRLDNSPTAGVRNVDSKRLRGDPFQSYRRIFDHFQEQVNKAMIDVSSQAQVDLRVPLIYRRFRMIMAPLIAEHGVEDQLEEIDEDEEFLERAKEMRHRVDQNPEKIAQRLRRYKKMEVLQGLAFKEGLLGQERDGPAETPPELTDNEIGLDEYEANAEGESQAVEASGDG